MLAERVRSGEESVGHEEWAAGDGVKFRTSQGDRHTAITERSHLAASLDTVSARVNSSRNEGCVLRGRQVRSGSTEPSAKATDISRFATEAEKSGLPSEQSSSNWARLGANEQN